MSISSDESFRYLTITARDRDRGRFVTGAGWMSVPPGGSYLPHVHPDLYQYSWPQKRVLPEFPAASITQGAGEFESESAGPKKVRPGSLILTFPGEWHRYRPYPDVGWDEHWIGFHGSIANRLAGLCTETDVE